MGTRFQSARALVTRVLGKSKRRMNPRGGADLDRASLVAARGLLFGPVALHPCRWAIGLYAMRRPDATDTRIRGRRIAGGDS